MSLRIRPEQWGDEIFARSFPEPNSGCWIWMGSLSGGYGQLGWNNQRIRAHQASYIAHNGPVPDGLIVCHHCDNKACVNPGHLYAGTHKENTADIGRRQGFYIQRHPETSHFRRRDIYRVCGESLGQAKLTVEKVREIKARFANGEGQRALGRAFGVSIATISDIVHDRTWMRALAESDAMVNKALEGKK
jgi:hypothetical protein